GANDIASNDEANGTPLLEAEKELVAVKRLLGTGDLKTLDATSLKSLTHLAEQLDAMLAAGYTRIARGIENDAVTAADARAAQLAALAERTACDSCRTLLAQKAESVRNSAVPAPVAAPPAAEPAPVPMPPAT